MFTCDFPSVYRGNMITLIISCRKKSAAGSHSGGGSAQFNSLKCECDNMLEFNLPHYKKSKP